MSGPVLECKAVPDHVSELELTYPLHLYTYAERICFQRTLETTVDIHPIKPVCSIA